MMTAMIMMDVDATKTACLTDETIHSLQIKSRFG